MYADLLSGDLLDSVDIEQIREFPLPADNWYEWASDEDLASLPSWGSAPLTPFALIDDGGADGVRWIPVEPQ